MTSAEAERKILGFDHTMVGEYLIKKWNLPEVFRFVTRYHHSMTDIDKAASLPFAKVIAIINVADTICEQEQIGFGGERNPAPLNENIWQLIGLSKEEVSNSLAKLHETVDINIELFGMQRS